MNKRHGLRTEGVKEDVITDVMKEVKLSTGHRTKNGKTKLSTCKKHTKDFIPSRLDNLQPVVDARPFK